MPSKHYYIHSLCKIIFILIFNRDGIKTGSCVISSQVAQGVNGLATPVTIDFDLTVENFAEPHCVFWDFSDPYV